MQEQKICQCGIPSLRQAVPEGFKGMVRCSRCEGLFEYPIKKIEYHGTDPIEAHLCTLSEATANMTNEQAVIIMLLRIERQLINLNDALNGKPDQKSEKEPGSSRRK